eukprot:scaffold435_cov275-Chaetoceros_neogracile.AAC.23
MKIISSQTLLLTSASFAYLGLLKGTANAFSVQSFPFQHKSLTPSSGSSSSGSTKRQAETKNPSNLFAFTPFLQTTVKQAQQLLTTTILATTLLLASPAITHASSSDYAAMTDEQKAVAEAWRIVDNNFIDRTFNNQDWFKVRQDVVKKKYKNMNEAQVEIETIVASLGDKYTRYLPPAKYRSIVDAATGTLAGVGVEISTNKDAGTIIVADTEPTSPANIEVDGVKFNDGKSTPDDVAARLRGPEGSKVGIVMERDGKVLDFILTRRPITITSVRSYISEKSGVGKVGVVRIKSFSGTTAVSVQEALKDLKKKGAESFVLDVRGNPGGLLPGGTDTAAIFLEANKPLVFVVDKKGVQDNQLTFQDGSVLDEPLAIVVNGNTASAAEVMTAALKENQRATIVGEKTFGKGIIQTIRQLGYDNGGVAVTVARYETPLHNNINKLGIAVDVQADCNNEDAAVCVPNSVLQKK